MKHKLLFSILIGIFFITASNVWAAIGDPGQYSTQCADGSTSSSTGSGTCSWHGGIASDSEVNSNTSSGTSLMNYYNRSNTIYSGIRAITFNEYVGYGHSYVEEDKQIVSVSNSYQSKYDLIQWPKRYDDSYYCLDICDEFGNIYPGLQAIQCGENLYSWSPQQYIENTLGINSSEFSGFTFTWRIWSSHGYGGTKFQGIVIVP